MARARAKWIFGPQQTPSQRDSSKPISIPTTCSADAKKFGLENFGNTCYANSVVQALYFCTPFRDLLLQSEEHSIAQGSQDALSGPPALVPVRRPSVSGSADHPIANGIHPHEPPTIPSSPPTLFSALRSLYFYISTNPADSGTVAPRAFIDKVKQGNDIFRSTMHQDAHEFLNYLLNKIVEEIEEEKKLQHDAMGEDLSNSVATLSSKSPPTIITATTSSNSGTSPQDATLVHKLFEGVLTSETRCLTCETVSARDESFLDLSIDIEQNSSVTACLRQFSASEMLCQKNKFFCDSCCDLQEAEKRMKIKKLPNVLALHLKRFKYQEDVQKYIKLAYRVAFPIELRLFNTVDDTEDADRLYNLFGIVVHIGTGPHHGHYISIIKTGGSWLVFDDDNVYPLPEGDISKYFGDSPAGSAYVLYYQAADLNLPALGLRNPSPAPPEMSEQALSPAGSVEASPALPINPPLPPGLAEEGDSSDISDPPFPVTPSQSSSPLLHPSDKKSSRQTLDVKVSVLEEASSPPSPSIASSPAITPTTSSNTRSKGFFTRRRPSTSAGALHGPEFRESSEQVAMPASLLSTASSDEPNHRAPTPPPPSLPSSPDPGANGHENGHHDHPHHLPERKPSTWFKRKSFRLGDKRPASQAGLPQIPQSPTVPSNPKEEGSSHWFNTTAPPSPRERRRRPSEPGMFDASAFHNLSSASRPKTSGGGLSVNANHHHRHTHDYESSSPVSPSSSFGSTSHLLPTFPATPSSHTPSSPSPSTPSRKSLEKPSSPKAPEHKKSLSSLIHHKDKARDHSSLRASPPPRPATAIGNGHSTSPRQLPPVPPLPPSFVAPGSPIRSMYASNGHASVDHVVMANDKGKMKSEHPDTDEHPNGWGTFPGANHSSASTSSSSNTSSHWKRTSRKLSLTLPLLHFGKKKEKDKDKDKDRDKEGKGAPSSFPHFSMHSKH
ncbi:cysteine proteinase [Armillaria solidipes]|uniref:Ubiquitin carboxyl-terminal hydrolase n=1 Tax=Armillaria solidipes TaxID=1076256 RepID=A0A2H3CBE6_9AGAR|nr:cysteine proteinase [Armillaria solidipes]